MAMQGRRFNVRGAQIVEADSGALLPELALGVSPSIRPLEIVSLSGDEVVLAVEFETG